MKWLIYVFLVFNLSSCIEMKQSEYNQKIDQSIETLKQSKKKLSNPIFDSIPIVVSEINSLKSNIRTFLKNDTLPLDIALKIDEISHIDIALQNIEANKIIALKDINVVIQNLNNLKKDINNSSGDRGKYDENIEVEKSKQIILVDAVDDYFNDCTNSLQSFNEIKTELISFSNKLKLKNEEQKLIP